MAKADHKFTSADLRMALRKRYPPDSHSLVFEVSAQTGGGAKRADAVAVSLWKSNGHEAHGFEIKVSRQDLLKELGAPDKHVHVSRYCHRWWLVTPTGLVRDGELPDGWGLLELNRPEGDLRQAVKAPMLDPIPMDTSFVGSLLRGRSRLDDEEIKKVVDSRVAERDSERRQRFKQEVQWEASHLTSRAESVIKRAEELKALTGIDLFAWHPEEDQAALLRSAMSGQVVDLFRQLRHLRTQLNSVAGAIDDAVPEQPARPAAAAGTSA